MQLLVEDLVCGQASLTGRNENRLSVVSRRQLGLFTFIHFKI